MCNLHQNILNLLTNISFNHEFHHNYSNTKKKIIPNGIKKDL
jgi:hypothetical protein